MGRRKNMKKAQRPLMTEEMLEEIVRDAEFFCPHCGEWITEEVHLQHYHYTTFKKDKLIDERIRVGGVVFESAEKFKETMRGHKINLNLICDKIDEIIQMLEDDEEPHDKPIHEFSRRMEWMAYKSSECKSNGRR